MIKTRCQALAVAFANFCGMNAPTMVNFKLPMCHTEHRVGKRGTVTHVTYSFLQTDTINLNNLRSINNSKIQENILEMMSFVYYLCFSNIIYLIISLYTLIFNNCYVQQPTHKIPENVITCPKLAPVRHKISQKGQLVWIYLALSTNK